MVQRNERVRPDSEEKSIRRKAIVVGPQRLYRDVLASFLSATGLAVVAEGSDLAGVWKAIDLKAQPEILVYCFPRPEGFEHDLKFARRIRDHLPEIKIVGLAESVSPRIFLRTIPLGVDCILLNDASSELLRRAIEFVLLGQQIFPLGLVQAAVLAAVQESPPERGVVRNGISLATASRKNPPAEGRRLIRERSPDRAMPCPRAFQQGGSASTERH